MYVDDLADAVIFFVNKRPRHNLINIGRGKDMSIKDYAKRIMKIVNYEVPIKFDRTKPNGMRRKILDVSLANSYGWKSTTPLDIGIKKTYLQISKNKN